MSKIEIKNLHLIFGSAKKQAIKMLKQEKSKAEILKKTKCTIAVNDANLSIEEGEIFVIMGLSGSGKSSLLRCINMLNLPTSGEILIDGENITRMDKEALLNTRRKKIGMVFQNFGLLPHRTIISNIAYGLEIQDVPIEVRIEKALEMTKLVGLSGYEQSFPQQLSGGMQQRVGLARALATDSQILLMDEAFSALDPLIRVQMQDELIDIQQKVKKTIVFITHDLDEALKLGNRIAIMKDGRIVQVGEPEEILLNPADEYVSAFVENVEKGKIITASAIMENFSSKIVLDKDGPAFAQRQVAKTKWKLLPVVNYQNQFVGYITEKKINMMIENRDLKIRDLMTSEVSKVLPDTPVSDLLPLFTPKNVSMVIVVDDNERLLGYVKHSDVVSVVTGYDSDEIKTIIENAL